MASTRGPRTTIPASVSRTTARATSVRSSSGCGQGTTVALQVDQGMGEHQIVFADVLVVALDVVFELRAVLGKVVAGRGHGHAC